MNEFLSEDVVINASDNLEGFLADANSGFFYIRELGGNVQELSDGFWAVRRSEGCGERGIIYLKVESANAV